MAANKPVWGIDLGQCALKAIQIRPADGKVEVVDHVLIEHDKILSQPEADRAALVTASMQKFLDKHDLSNEILVVGVPGQHTLARFTKLPPVDKKKIPEIVKYEAQQQIPFDMEEVIWDYQTFTDPDAMETEVGIFAMRRELMRDHLRFLSDLNLEPALVQSTPLALYNALKFDGLCGDEPIAILDIGAQNTDLLAVDGNSLWTRNIPIGGNNFTEALVTTFKLSFNKAENLKRSAGSSKYARQIFQAMRPVFADLVGEIQRSIGFYTSSRRGVKLGKVLAMGSAFKLPGLPKFLQQNLGLEVIRPTTFGKLSTSESPNAPQLIDHLLSFGVAYGLAVQGLGQSQITSNLLPPEIAKQIIWRKKSPWFYGTAASLVLAAGLVWGRNLSDQSVLAEATGANASAPRPPASMEAASRVIEQGPGEQLCSKFYADQIVKAGQFLGQAKRKAETDNEQQLDRADKIKKLQSDKVVWPVILDVIHSSLPQQEPEISRAVAEGPTAYKALIDSNPDKYARAKRKQIFIEKFDASYSSDVLSQYDETYNSLKGSSTGGGGTPGAKSPTAPAQKGFVIRLVGRTPFAAGDRRKAYAFLKEGLLADIQKSGEQKEFYFAKTNLLPIRQFGSGSDRRSSAGGATMRPGDIGDIATVRDGSSNKDFVTGETLVNDWQFEMLFAVILGPKPAEPEA